jgi:hypothetical protein
MFRDQTGGMIDIRPPRPARPSRRHPVLRQAIIVSALLLIIALLAQPL